MPGDFTNSKNSGARNRDRQKKKKRPATKNLGFSGGKKDDSKNIVGIQREYGPERNKNATKNTFKTRQAKGG